MVGQSPAHRSPKQIDPPCCWSWFWNLLCRFLHVEHDWFCSSAMAAITMVVALALQVWLSESDLGLVMRFVNRPEAGRKLVRIVEPTGPMLILTLENQSSKSFDASSFRTAFAMWFRPDRHWLVGWSASTSAHTHHESAAIDCVYMKRSRGAIANADWMLVDWQWDYASTHIIKLESLTTHDLPIAV